MRPNFFHRFHVECGDFADIALRTGHLIKTPIAGGAAGAFDELDFAPGHLHTALAERNNQHLASGVITHGLPVVATLGARAGRYPLAGFGGNDVRPIRKQPLFPIKPSEDVLKHGFLRVDELAGLPIKLPQNASLADREGDFSITNIN